jgi:hypothetical protein
MDARVVCDENQFRNTEEERSAFARGWRLWVHGQPAGDCDGAVEVVGWRFAAYAATKLGSGPQLAHAYDAAMEFLQHAPGCDTCSGTGTVSRDGITVACPVCRSQFVPVVGTAVRA